MVTTTTLQTIGTPTVSAGGSVVGSGAVWSDGSDATYVRVNRQVPDRQFPLAEALLPARPDATSAEVVEVRFRASSDPANPEDMYIARPVLMVREGVIEGGEGTYWAGQIAFFGTSITDCTSTDPYPNSDSLLELQNGTLRLRIMGFDDAYTNPSIEGFNYFWNVYEVEIDMILDRTVDTLDILMENAQLTLSDGAP